ncbi:MAG TPA: transporter substrate-binding domain-containing protein [Candidatus Dormibacteraeota bacterium]|jgi:polar amino acid transport system substrate-binding protein|nr:transporter substrate-binding domain-containing protein [Candidatus Dormibacteraeota bacterium]
MKAASTGRLALSAFLAITLGACTAPGPGVVKATASPFAISSPTPPAITPPTTLVRPGTLTFLSDTTYPPQESIDPSSQKAVGFDIDIAQAIAAKMGLSATIQSTNSPQIVGALLAKKGDAIISALQITPDLERQVALVAYFQAGQSILVRKGTTGISGITDLCGKKVAVQVQSPEENTIDEANGGVCKDSTIKKQVYPTDLQAVLILKQRGVEAALDDSPVAAYFVKQTPDQLELAGPPIKANPEGIAVDPKNGELLRAVQQAMMAIYKDGSYRQILTQWNLLDGEIPASQIIVNPSPTTS